MEKPDLIYKQRIKTDDLSVVPDNKRTSEDIAREENNGHVQDISNDFHNHRDSNSIIAFTEARLEEPPAHCKHELSQPDGAKTPTANSIKRDESSDSKQNRIYCRSPTPLLKDASQCVANYILEYSVLGASTTSTNDTGESEQNDCEDCFISNAQWWWDSENLAGLGYRTYGQSSRRVSRAGLGISDGTSCQGLDSTLNTGTRGSSIGETSDSVNFVDSATWSVEQGLTSPPLDLSQLDELDSGVASIPLWPSPHTFISQSGPLTSTPFPVPSVESKQSPSISPILAWSSRCPISETPNRRPEMTFHNLEPMKLTDLYSRARLGGEADVNLDISLLESKAEETDGPIDSTETNQVQVSDNEREDDEGKQTSLVSNCTGLSVLEHSNFVVSLGDKTVCIDEKNILTANGLSSIAKGELSRLHITDSTPEKAISNVDHGFTMTENSHDISINVTKQGANVRAGDVTDNASLYLIELCKSVESDEHSSPSSVDSGLSAVSPFIDTDTIRKRDRQDCPYACEESHSLSLKSESDKYTEPKDQQLGISRINEKRLANPGFHLRSRSSPERNCASKCFDTSGERICSNVDLVEIDINRTEHDGDDLSVENCNDIHHAFDIDVAEDEVFSEKSSCSESGLSRGSPNNFALLFRHFRCARDAASAKDNAIRGEEIITRPSPLIYDVGQAKDSQVLCAERVSQMTKTYNDIEAVTRLLEEKERDLELAARIGQTLLSKNKELVSRTEALEEQLAQATERSNQLRHEMGMKDELLRFYNEDLERDAAGGDTPPDEKPAVDVVNVDFLEKKVKSLEDENLHLRLESANLQSATSNYEDKEKKLVEDCIQQLAEVNQQVETFAAELQHKSEESLHQKEEIKTFLGQIAGLQTKIRKLTLENMDVHEKLTASTESQRKLTKELGTMQDRYDELMEMLEETQDELQLMRSRQRPRSNANSQHQAADFTVPTDSLASELENSLRQEQPVQRRAQSWRVFETAKAAKKAAAKTGQSSSSTSRMSISASGDATGPPSVCDSSQLSTCPSDIESQTSDGYSGDMDSLYESNSELGRPGIPGSNDLDNALRRLATRRANEMNEREFLAREVQSKRKFSGSSESSLWSNQTFDASGRDGLGSGGSTAGGGGGGPSISRPHSPSGSVSSLWSSGAGSAQVSGGSASGQAGQPGQSFKISDRLQIVKPMEGSMTLRHWKHLANPHLGGLFQQREGIQMKGEKAQASAAGGEAYSILDFEEDDEPQDIHTRKEQEHGLIYTFTDSTVQTFGSNLYQGLGTLFDSSMESSPSKANFSTSSIGSDRLAFGTSTPKLSARSVSSTTSPPNTSRTDPGHGNTPTSYTMSSGLASLLDTKESPIVGKSLMRAASIPKLNLNSVGGSKTSKASVESNGFLSLSARSFSTVSVAASSNTLKPTQTTAASTVSALDLNPSWTSWASRSMGNLSSFPPPSSSTSSALPSSLWKQRLPGSGSMEEASLSLSEQDNSKQKDESGAVTVSDPNSPRRTAIFTPGMTGQGLLQQLKNKSLSLYGLWSGMKENPGDEKSSPRGARPRLASGTSIDAGFEELASKTATLATAKEDESNSEGVEPSAESILSNDSGVVGAMVNFRRGGIL